MIAQICGSDSIHDISIYHAAFVAQVIFTGTLMIEGQWRCCRSGSLGGGVRQNIFLKDGKIGWFSLTEVSESGFESSVKIFRP
jgi:hypothetical protein